MKNTTLGGFSTINGYVADKLKRFSETNKDFAALFEFMFSERDNVLFEKSLGYRIAKITYGQTRDTLLRRAFVLREKLSDLPRGSVVGLYLENSAEWIELFWAILACGFDPLLMNTRLDRQSLEEALSCVDAKAVIASDGTQAFSIRTMLLSELEPQNEALEPASFGESIFVMSSGTSEHVKVCEYTGLELYQTLKDSFDIIRACPAMKKHYRGQLKHLAFLPFYHIFGFVAVYLWFGFFSRTFVLLKDYSPVTIMDTIRRHEVTHIFAVPLFWNKVYDEAIKAIDARGEKVADRFKKGLGAAERLSGVPLLLNAFRRAAFKKVRGELFGESTRFLISGGSEISKDVLGFFNGIGYHLANGYGMTETGITSAELSGDLRLLSSGSAGLPFSSVEYRLGDDGELYVKGSSLARKILEDGRELSRGEWFKTNDAAEFSNGRWYIKGRLDDLVISPTGENLNPCIIEDKLSIKGAKQVCLTSVRENGLITPVLAVQVDPALDGKGINGVYEDAKAALKANGLYGQIPRIALVREPLIGGDDFKLNRRKTAKRLERGELCALDPDECERTGSSDALTYRICGLFAKVLGKDPSSITPLTDFFLDAGGTSLDYFSFVTELQNEFGYALPEGSSRALSRPCDISDCIRQAVNR